MKKNLLSSQIIEQTEKWITDVVVGCNFCPFASRPLTQKRIHYQVDLSIAIPAAAQAFLTECRRLDEQEEIETSLLILPNAVPRFSDYLDLIALAEVMLKRNGYESVYQVAGFHPLYRFNGAGADDASNYTNRSIYPMLHLLREESISQALRHYSYPEKIPEQNIQFARGKGVVYMKMLWDACLKI
ncbi:MAG TPA: DUF1415 domain-containing protein [Puia sp.]|nr:DUF1415 domain-containing protein [Puia sp.]